MHIPENYLSPATCAVMTAAMVPVWVHSVKKVKEELPKDKIAMVGVGGYDVQRASCGRDYGTCCRRDSDSLAFRTGGSLLGGVDRLAFAGVDIR